MMRNKLKDKIKDDRVAVGTFLFTPSPTVMEILGYAGFDFAIIDTEHAPTGPLDTATLENLVRAAEVSGIVPLVRLPEHSRIMTQKALDSGALGIVVPGVRTKEEAIQVVRATKYPPEGDRGCCYLTRVTGFTSAYDEGYWSRANQNTMVALLIENREAVNNLEDIISVDGIDFLFFGPRDFSMSQGYSTVDNPVTKEARAHVEEICHRNEMPLARFLYPPFEESVKKSVDEGARILVAGGDVALLYQASREITNIVHNLQQ